ncbi:MAG: hypothetical protein QXN15_10885 [Candidatus Jordarchaeales archaeon]|nr:hypothetical protein [Candidatus Jordarchaeia archaeon]
MQGNCSVVGRPALRQTILLRRFRSGLVAQRGLTVTAEVAYVGCGTPAGFRGDGR